MTLRGTIPLNRTLRDAILSNRMHRFIVTSDLSANQIVINDHALQHQLERVLHIAVGENVVLVDGAGTEAVARVLEYGKQKIIFAPVSATKTQKARGRSTTLYLAIIKHDNFELAVEKAVEAGIDSIVPIVTGRTIKKAINNERVLRIIKEATEQSGRAFLAHLGDPIHFKQAIKEAAGTKLLCDTSGQAVPTLTGTKAASIFIGPEGGFTREEVAYAKESACAIVSLGPTVLRAETAAIVGSYLISG